MHRARLMYTYITSIVITQCLTAVRNDDGFCVCNVTVLYEFFPSVLFCASADGCFYFGSVIVPRKCVRWFKLGLYRFQRNTLLYNVKCRHMSSVESLNFLMLQSSGQFGRSFISHCLKSNAIIWPILHLRAYILLLYRITITTWIKPPQSMPGTAYIKYQAFSKGKCKRVLTYYTI